MSSVRYLLDALVQKGSGPLQQLQQLVLQDSARITALESADSTDAATYLAAMSGPAPASWLGWFSGRLRLTSPAGQQPSFELSSSTQGLRLSQAADASTSTVQALTGSLAVGTPGGGILVEPDGDVVVSKNIVLGSTRMSWYNGPDYSGVQFACEQPADAPAITVANPASGRNVFLSVLDNATKAAGHGVPLNSVLLKGSHDMPLYIGNVLHVPSLYLNGTQLTLPATQHPDIWLLDVNVSTSFQRPLLYDSTNVEWFVGPGGPPQNGAYCAIQIDLTTQGAFIQNFATIDDREWPVLHYYSDGFPATGSSRAGHIIGAVNARLSFRRFSATLGYLYIRTTQVAWQTEAPNMGSGRLRVAIKAYRAEEVHHGPT